MFFPWEVLVLSCDDMLTFCCGNRIKMRHLLPPKGLNEVPMKGFDDDAPMALDEAPNIGFEELSPIDQDPMVAPTDCDDIVDIVGIDCDMACDIVGVPPIDVSFIELEFF